MAAKQYLKFSTVFINTVLLGALLLSVSSATQAALTPDLRKMLAVMNVGTAWAVAPGFIITNKHVVEDEKKVLFMRADESTFEGELVLDDPDNDLALFYVEPEEIKGLALPFAGKQSSIGAQVFTIGFPHPSVLGISPKLTMGHINSERGFEDNPNTYQVSVPLQSGNSGGPLVNMRGEVVGITSWKLNAERMYKLTGDVPQNVNYAVKVGLLKKLMNDIPLKWKTRAAKSHNTDEFETVVKGIKDSVFIVLAGEKDTSKIQPSNLDPLSSELFVNSRLEKQSMALIVYAAPKSSDLESMRRVATVATFSDVISKMVAKEVKFLSRNRTTVSYNVKGKRAARMLYVTENKHTSKSICRRHKVDLILTIEHEPDDSSYSRPVGFRIIDCDSLYEFKESTNVAHHYADKFATEVEFRRAFHRFMSSLPSAIHWLGRP